MYRAAKGLYCGKLLITSAELADEEQVSSEAFGDILNAMLIARYGKTIIGGNKMDQTRARELQEKLALEAAAMLSLAGSGAETAPYEQAVSLIGKAWRLTAEETSEQLALIEQEKAVMGRIENGEPAEHIRQELLLNWSGLESIEVLEDLFETSTLLETAPERRSLFDMAMLLIETQNLLDWIEKTDAEKEELIQNFT